KNVVCYIDRAYQSPHKRMYHLYSDRHLLACARDRNNLLHYDLRGDPGGSSVYYGSCPVPVGRCVWKNRSECTQDVYTDGIAWSGSWCGCDSRNLYKFGLYLSNCSDL